MDDQNPKVDCWLYLLDEHYFSTDGSMDKLTLMVGIGGVAVGVTGLTAALVTAIWMIKIRR